MSSALLGKSPLRTIESSLGPLGAGSLGLVLARTGVGKTAFLVQIALDVLARERGVLHFALGQTLDLVQSYYETLYEDLSTASGAGSAGREAAWTELVRRRIIQAFAERSISADRVEKALDTFAHSLAFRPEVILIDGFDWSGAVASTAATIGAFKSFARRVGAELWMSAQMPRAAGAPTRLPAPCDGYAAIIDRALVLEPTGPDVSVRVVLERGVEGAEAEMRLPVVHLQPDTLRLAAAEGDQESGGPRFPRSAYTLLSGAAQGAEAEFGACAERHGIAEINFSFEGHAAARTRGLVQLSEQELRQGDVSSPKLTSHISRTYPGTPIFRKVLQSIWHQVHTAGEVFVVGSILPDDTIKGGTGWAAELAKHEQKPLHVYCQERHGWSFWNGHAFEPDPAPIITRTRFTGTGTRFLTDDGRAAIRALFERSFGKPAAKG